MSKRTSWSLLGLAAALVGLGCATAGDVASVPLYPDAKAQPLPRSQLAQVSGPIAKVDGRDVIDQGGVFDLLPGCHIVELDRRASADNYALSGGVYLSGQHAMTIYALRMKAGARYTIRRDMRDAGGGRVDVSLSAVEEAATGQTIDLSPARSEDDLRFCREWEASVLHHK